MILDLHGLVKRIIPSLKKKKLKEERIGFIVFSGFKFRIYFPLFDWLPFQHCCASDLVSLSCVFRGYYAGISSPVSLIFGFCILVFLDLLNSIM